MPLIVAALFASACGADLVETSAEPVPTSLPGNSDGFIAGMTTSQTDVPLEDIVFDTFDGGSLLLSEATDMQVASLLDAIPPIDAPRYQTAAEAGWLDDDDLVIGYKGTVSGRAWAFPHRVLNSHELVAETIDGIPLVITYCPLCRSGVVFDRRMSHPDFTGTLDFGNTSALYNNDMVMVDRATGSYWWQVAGRSIVGTMSGAELDILPSQTVTWSAWRSANPDTTVLSNDQGFGRSYEHRFESYADRVNAGQTPFPVEPEVLADDRLAPAERIIGIEVDGQAYAVPVEGRPTGTVDVAGTVVVELDGQGGGAVIDTATGKAFPSRSSFWFAYLAAFPKVVLIDS